MKCIIGGCARNIEKQLEVSLPDIIKIGEQFDEYSILIYENDSTDRTLDIIKTFQRDYPEINLISEKLVVGTRTEILSHGRNILLQQVIDNYSEYDFYIQMDLDYMRPTTFNMKNILQGWKSEWNGITAVSEEHYYDWYALIIDNKKQMWDLSKRPLCLIHGDDKDADHGLCESWACNSFCKWNAEGNIGPTSVKQVISAFNGIGVYKISRIIEKDTCFYLGSKDGKQLCEHVMFHKCLGNIYIHPELVTQTTCKWFNNWSRYFKDNETPTNKYYGYDFTARNSGGLGAIIHDVMNAFKYATDNNLTLGFIRDGYEIPRLNGSYDDTSVPDKNWHSYFTSFEKIDRIDCVGVWPQVVVSVPEKTRDIETYSKIIRKNVCTFVPDVYDEICELVKQTPFNEITDIVVHIRLTDKKTETPVFLPLQNYIDECEYALSQLKDEINRIYICTDDQSVCPALKSYFNSKNIEVVWDETESLEPLHTIKWREGVKKSVAQLENMNAFKNIQIMASAKYRIGGRMSYFFRIAELLGYPNTQQ